MEPFTLSVLSVILLFSLTSILVIIIFLKFPGTIAGLIFRNSKKDEPNADGGQAAPSLSGEIDPAKPGIFSLLTRLTFRVNGALAGIVILLLFETAMIHIFYSRNSNAYTEYLQSRAFSENLNLKDRLKSADDQVRELKGKVPWKVKFMIGTCYNKEREFRPDEYARFFSFENIAVSPCMFETQPGLRMVIAEVEEEKLKQSNWTCGLTSTNFAVGTRVFSRNDSCFRIDSLSKTIAIGPFHLNSIDPVDNFGYEKKFSGKVNL